MDGVQPTRDDAVQCLDCGQWFGQLSSHLSRTHGTPAADYRARHGLGLGVSLSSPAIQRQHSERLLARRAAGDPGVNRLEDHPERQKERAEASIQARAETKDRASVLTNRRASAEHAQQARSDNAAKARAARARIHEARAVVAAAAIAEGVRTLVVADAIGVTPDYVDALVRETKMLTKDQRMDRRTHHLRDDPKWIDSLTAALIWRAREGHWPRQIGAWCSRPLSSRDTDEVRLGTWVNTQRAAVHDRTILGHREGLLRAVALIA